MQFAERCYLPFLLQSLRVWLGGPTCPDAMMVHLHDTSEVLSDAEVLVALQSNLDLPFAGLAVMSTWRFGHFTLPTIPLSRGSLRCQTCTIVVGLDALVPVVRDLPGICETGAGVADEKCCHEDVEEVCLSFS